MDELLHNRTLGDLELCYSRHRSFNSYVLCLWALPELEPDELVELELLPVACNSAFDPLIPSPPRLWPQGCLVTAEDMKDSHTLLFPPNSSY